MLTSTWAMKKKANGEFRSRLNARGYEQVGGTHFIPDSIAAPVTNPNTVRILLVLWCMNPDWIAVLIDVEGAFLQGQFKDGEELYMEVPEGFESYYPSGVVLKLNVPIYGTKQAAKCFYKKLVQVLKLATYERSMADPCLYFKWVDGRLCVMVSWVDDLIAMGCPRDVERMQRDLENKFTCKREGVMTEYVGSKLDMTRGPNGLGRVKFTQPVMVKKLGEVYDELPKGRAMRTPAVAGQVLRQGDGSGAIVGRDVTKYRSATAMCMFMMQWSRPEIFNATRGLARQMSQPRLSHETALKGLIKYVINTENRGLVLAPDSHWDGSKEFEFTIGGASDSDYATNPDDRRSVTGKRTLLNGAPVMFASATQKFVTLSVTEAESAAGVSKVQDMMYVYRLLKSMGLCVKLPMILEMDNKGAVDLAKNLSISG